MQARRALLQHSRLFGLSRTLKLSPFRQYSAPPPISDPTRPDEIFYHHFEAPNRISSQSPIFAVSFLKTRPLVGPESVTVAGWLPAREDAGLNDFKENSKFINVLHKSIQETLNTNSDDIWRNAAVQLGSDLNRIGDPDDIIGTVLVENGRIQAQTYQSMPSYRICTGDGLTQLTPAMKAHLLQSLERLNSENQ
ncbi:hypothetical protein DL96DRAFT_1596717 [Flagelloscypha sp. PMI_526]|nr:hypothetical protein DL96DRAFT_1596717 [Flagelloscypha sp. PMI_526]